MQGGAIDELGKSVDSKVVDRLCDTEYATPCICIRCGKLVEEVLDMFHYLGTE